MVLADFLNLLAAYNEESKILRVDYSLKLDRYRQSSAHPIEDREAACFESMLSSFRYFSDKFRHFWFEETHLENVVRQNRPDIELFSAIDFEMLVGSVLYLVTDKEFRLTQQSHDRGIDLFCTEEIPQASGWVAVLKRVVQCKLLRGTIPVSQIRDFFGVMTNEVAAGYFFSTGELTVAGSNFVISACRSTWADKLFFVGKVKLAELLDLCDQIVDRWDEIASSHVEAKGEREIEDAHRKLCNLQEDAHRLITRQHTVSPQTDDGQLKLF